MTTDPELLRLLDQARERVKKMTPEELAAMHKAQRESYVRAEMNWPETIVLIGDSPMTPEPIEAVIAALKTKCDFGVQNGLSVVVVDPLIVSRLLDYVEGMRWRPSGGFRERSSFIDARENAKLRPIAETLAMLDSNAFFGATKDDSGDDTWYLNYLPEAHALYESNGGDNGWAGQASFSRSLPPPPVKGGEA